MANVFRAINIPVGRKDLTIETGRLARQAGGSVLVSYGGTSVLVTAVVSENKRDAIDFLPLTVDYLEKYPSAGKIPGGYFKREGRPSEKEIITCRLIDRSIRPLLSNNGGFFNDTQVVATVLSMDQENDADCLALTGASAALMLSSAPLREPFGGVRVGYDGKDFIINPTKSQMKDSLMDIVIAGTEDSIVMVEGSAQEIDEELLLQAMKFGHKYVKSLVSRQYDLIKGEVEKIELQPSFGTCGLYEEVERYCGNRMEEALSILSKKERRRAIAKLEEDILCEFMERRGGKMGENPISSPEIARIVKDISRKILRKWIINDGRRIDGRGARDLREITCEVGILPRVHGSALFTRGETQALATITLGTFDDYQRIDALEGEFHKVFMVHYNFPPYSVGEVKMMRSPSRREIGHGNLAERALKSIVPSEEIFPYIIRIVSEILESNGSSSMATVCAGCLAMMDAGVPISAPVSGIAMGLVKEGENVVILTDILGDEDHLGDMDFKVAGTKKGITACQMDIKMSGVSYDIIFRALESAKEARFEVMEKMLATLPAPREEISPFAPRITSIYIREEQIKDLIGPGGKNIRSITEKTGVKIEVENSGKVNLASNDAEAMKRAIDLIKEVVKEVELGRIYKGKVKRITEFGAFVEILPGVDGLVHISQIARERVARVSDYLREGQEVYVKVIDIDRQGKVRLSIKQAKVEMDRVKRQ